MAFVPLINALVLTFAPYIIVLQFSKLKDHIKYKTALKVLAVYVVSAIIKVVVDVILPPGSPSKHFTLDAGISVILKSVIDLIGMTISLSLGSGTESRIWTVGMSWAVGRCLFSRFLPIWMESNALEWNSASLVHSLLAHWEAFIYCALSFALWLLKSQNAKRRGMAQRVSLFTLTSFLIISVIQRYMEMNHFSSFLEFICFAPIYAYCFFICLKCFNSIMDDHFTR
ncbi:putative membrane protein (DUF2053) [Monocercomonoides exilis]|uniref:putative membrane protein (DUF2053) n=1 Tax=Monocercomonoides exilis TaxID=2049356 RepID=UPI0035595F08|nr:putative membrane protein (DUF2053) [Monocercomonoides exilis]